MMERRTVQKQYRLAKRKDFGKVYKLGQSVANRQFVIYVLKNPKTERMRTGVSVSKKLGGAVLRNRLRRQVKEIMRLNVERIEPGHDIVIIVRRAAVGMAYREMEKSLQHALKRASLWRKN
jgi:ribonuclease P protein component